jgi:hypothetical protein
MTWYRCLIRGENFLKTAFGDDGEPLGVARYGFYATRWVVAGSPRDAEMKALHRLHREKVFEPPAGHPRSADAKVFLEKIEQAKPPQRRIGGATWFPMDD